MGHRSETLVVERPPGGQRLDVYLHAAFPAVSRGAIQRLIQEGAVRVDGLAVKAAHEPRRGAVIEIRWPAPRAATARPEAIPLDILYEDADLLVVNKAPGLVVHPAAGHEDHTLVNALIHHCGGQLSGIGGVARPGSVHRLDKETSGCLVVAKHDAAHLGLATQFQERKVRKTYQALVCGVLPRDTGEIRAGIARHPSHRKRMAVAAGGGRDAWTTYRVLRRFPGATLIEARLHTGRTHQVRVHFQHLGHPLVGDTTYGKRQNQRLSEQTGYTVPRLMLHAWRLAFTHPTRGTLLACEAPRPRDFEEALGVFAREAPSV